MSVINPFASCFLLFDYCKVVILVLNVCYCRIILYAIVLADYDQDSGEGCKKLIKTKEGIESIALYIKSVGR